MIKRTMQAIIGPTGVVATARAIRVDTEQGKPRTVRPRVAPGSQRSSREG